MRPLYILLAVAFVLFVITQVLPPRSRKLPDGAVRYSQRPTAAFAAVALAVIAAIAVGLLGAVWLGQVIAAPDALRTATFIWWVLVALGGLARLGYLHLHFHRAFVEYSRDGFGVANALVAPRFVRWEKAISARPRVRTKRRPLRQNRSGWVVTLDDGTHLRIPPRYPAAELVDRVRVVSRA